MDLDDFMLDLDNLPPSIGVEGAIRSLGGVFSTTCGQVLLAFLIEIRTLNMEVYSLQCLLYYKRQYRLVGYRLGFSDLYPHLQVKRNGEHWRIFQ